MGLALDDGWAIPFDHPHYPPLPAIYRHVRSHTLLFEADPSAVARLLPAPLRPDPEGRCVAIGLHVPECPSYGSFNEAIVELACTLDGRPGWYCSHVLHDGPRGIAAGREIYGTPKVFCELELIQDGPTLETRASVDGLRVFTLTTTTGDTVDPASLPVFAPNWRLKVIPRADRPGPALKQLIDAGGVNSEVTIHGASRASGSVRFAASPRFDLTSLAPLQMGDAFVSEDSFTEGFARIELDYLAGR